MKYAQTFRTMAAGVGLAAAWLLPQPAFALRPFESTDADVTAADEIELEVGLLTIERDAGSNSYIVPTLVLNYGLTDRIELVGEFELERPPHDGWQLTDPGVFIKGLLRKGALQGGTGLSLAMEVGALLPVRRGDHTGSEALLIASGRFAPFTFHVNLGGGQTRDSASFKLWGLIGEMPLSPTWTVVGEVAAEKAHSEPWERSALVGVVHETATGIQWDLAARHGLSDAAPDNSLTFGVTLTF